MPVFIHVYREDIFQVNMPQPWRCTCNQRIVNTSYWDNITKIIETDAAETTGTIRKYMTQTRSGDPTMMSSDSETLLSPITVWFGPEIIHQTCCGNIATQGVKSNRSVQELVPIYMTTEGWTVAYHPGWKCVHGIVVWAKIKEYFA